MPKIENLEKLKNQLNKLADKYRAGEKPSVVVGYTANYAVYVHESMKARHAAGKQAKFLEQPARQMTGQLGTIVGTAMASGTSLIQALYLAGLRLQRSSQEIVPIDTGNLRAGAFTAKESNLATASAAAAKRAAKVRVKGLARNQKTRARATKKRQRGRKKK